MERKDIDWGNLGFGYVQTDMRYVSNFRNGQWDDGCLTDQATITMSECACVLQYAQTCFEGLKAYTTEDGRIVCFRPDLNAQRMASSCRRLKMPVFPEDRFVQAVVETVRANSQWVPPYGSGATLYVRPFMFGSDAIIGVKPATEYQFRVFVTPVGPYFKGGIKPLKLRISDLDRAAPKGTGDVKAGLNYAMSLYNIVDAHEKGFDENVYVDSATRTHIEETGGANVIFVTKDGKLTVGMDTSYAPAEFLAADGKTPVGFDVDIVKALAKTFGLEADPQTSNFDSIIPSIGSKYDIGVSSFTITPERMKAVDFVSMFKAGSTWVVKKGNPGKIDTSDLCGLKIAVQTGTTQEEEVNKGAEQCKADNKLDIQILSNKLQTDVTTNVVTGKADVFYADSPVAGYAISQTDGQLEALGEDVGVTKEAVAIKKGDSDTAKAVQAAMQKLMDDGTYMKILKHWGVESGALDKAEINPTDLN